VNIWPWQGGCGCPMYGWRMQRKYKDCQKRKHVSFFFFHRSHCFMCSVWNKPGVKFTHNTNRREHKVKFCISYNRINSPTQVTTALQQDVSLAGIYQLLFIDIWHFKEKSRTPVLSTVVELRCHVEIRTYP